jgi:serine/threonine-protein kinase
LAEKAKNDNSQEKKHGLTSWLKLKLLGGEKVASPVDTQFLTDLSDVKTIGRYEIMNKLGQGSMGVVYLGRDPYINRNVSIKVSRPAADVGGEKANRYRERFFVEAQSAGRLMHPNIVAIYDAGMHKDFCYITMEYIDGPPLERFCRKDKLLPVSKVIEVLIGTCKALDYAHRKGVVHRDIKPSNIMFAKAGGIKITDFGVARIKSEQTISKGIVGSPSYMSPEQVKEAPVEDKSDIFSLGCVMYEMLTGQKAFSGDNYFSIMYKIINEDPLPMHEIRPRIPKIMARIAGKALAKDPNRRYQSCMDFAYDLSVALRGIKGNQKTEKAANIVEYVHHVPFFENFNKEQVKEILNASSIIRARQGKVLVTEGDIDDSFFIILSGKAAVKKSEQDIAIISRGECFGEMSYLSGQARAATVMAKTDCILMKISATLLDKSAESMQLRFLKNFSMTLIRRLSTSLNKFD